jgi:hypothetical protein
LRIGSGTLFAGVVALVGAGLGVYSQTAAFAWDEGWHLLAAQLILRGKTPYLDFVFSATPLHAYWNAAWMALLGESWRVAHAVATMATSGAIFLAADHLWRRFPIPHWRPAAAVFAAVAVGLNPLVVSFGTIAQPYGLCLLLLVAAFRVSLLAVEGDSRLLPWVAGLLSGAAAGSSLLTAPVGPILLAWLLHQRAGKRITKGAAFVGGMMVAFAPAFRLLILAPRNVLFGVLEYHAVYRRVGWEGAAEHNVDVMLSWIDSSHALLLVVLAAAGFVFVRYRCDWTRAQRAEFHLCLLLALGLGLFISTACPTFERYYLFLVPFLSIPAAAGLYWIASSLRADERPFRSVLVAVVLLVLGLGKALYAGRDDLAWKGFDEMVRLLERVTPRNALLLADEPVYFLTRRVPPEGMELDDSHKIELPEALARRLHLVSQAQLDERIRAGEFDTVEIPTSEDRIKRLDLRRIYQQEATFGGPDCSVFWGRVASSKR